MTFEQLIEYLGIDEPEIIDYNSEADFGGLTEEQRRYILSEFINGRPVYIMVSQVSQGGGDTSGKTSVSQESTREIVCTDTTLLLEESFMGFSSMSANRILLGSNVNIILAGSNSSIDNGVSYAY